MKKIINSFLLLLLLINYINCISYKWNKPSDGEVYLFEDQTNWDPNGIPNINDDALIDNGGTGTALSNIVVGSLTLYNGNFLYISSQMLLYNYLYMSTVLGRFIISLGGSIQTTNLVNEGTLECMYFDGNTQVFDCYIVHSRIIIRNVGDLYVGKNSKLSLFNDTIELYNWASIKTANNSHLALMGAGIYMYDNSTIYNTEGGTFYLNNTLQAQDESYVKVFKSIIEIHNYMVFYHSTSLNIQSGSFLYSYSNLVVYDDAFFNVEGGSYATFNGFIAFYNTSKLWVGDSSVVRVEDQLYGSYNSILSVWDSSYIYVRGSATFGNVINSNATIIIEKTCFIDNILSNTNGNFTVFGVFTFNAYIGYFDNSLIMNQGDFNLHGIIYANKTRIETKGNFNVYDGAFLWLFDCEVFVDGFISISNQSYLNIERTTFYVSDKGEMDSRGDIYLNKDTDFNNVGTLNIHSGIYFTNNTSIKSNNVSVSNSGTFNVLQPININVGFNNSGNINLNNNELFVYDLNQVNGSINLSGGTINSDNIFRINGGNIEGSGLVNNTVIQTNSIIGSKNQINNIIVNGNFVSLSSSKIILVVDSLDSFSTLDVLQDIEYNGEIEIRININLLNQIQYGSSSSNKNNNDELKVNNLINSGSSTSSSSSSSSSKINLINFKSNLNNNTFNSIKFKTYDPSNSNEDAKDYDGCNVSTSKSDKSFSLLFNDNSCGAGGGSKLTKKLSGGIIAAIVICCAVLIIIATVAFHYRERLRLISKTSKVGTRINSVRKSIRNSISLKSTNKDSN